MNADTKALAERGVMRALIYSDIFHFPLTGDELWRFSETSVPLTKAEITAAVRRLRSKVRFQKNYYCLRGKADIVNRRLEYIHLQKNKLNVASNMARLLSHIPTVRFIGISGTVAVGSAEAGDDIDFFVIAADKTLWITRALMIVLLSLKGKRRARTGGKTRDMVCLNMICEERSMGFDSSRRDIYTARECVQMLPVFSRGNTYQAFLTRNSWIASFFANGYIYADRLDKKVQKENVSHLWTGFFGLPFFEKCAYRSQRFFMEKHRTRETVERQFLALHPRDYRREVTAQFEAGVRATGY